jgi:hypothetical protein
MAYTFSRRNELAVSRGFASYYDQRKQFAAANRDHQLQYLDRYTPLRANRPQDVMLVKTWYAIYKQEATPYPESSSVRQTRAIWGHTDLWAWYEASDMDYEIKTYELY